MTFQVLLTANVNRSRFSEVINLLSLRHDIYNITHNSLGSTIFTTVTVCPIVILIIRLLISLQTLHIIRTSKLSCIQVKTGSHKVILFLTSLSIRQEFEMFKKPTTKKVKTNLLLTINGKKTENIKILCQKKSKMIF